MHGVYLIRSIHKFVAGKRRKRVYFHKKYGSIKIWKENWGENYEYFGDTFLSPEFRGVL